MKPLRIGINILFLLPGSVGGTEVYSRNLLQALAAHDTANEYFVYRNGDTDASIVPSSQNFHDRLQGFSALSRPLRIAYEQTAFLPRLASDRLDVLLNLGITAPLLYWSPMVTVFYDLQYKHFGRFLKKLDLIVTSLLFPASAARSKVILVLSEAVKRDIAIHYPWAAAKVRLTRYGVEADFESIRHRRLEPNFAPDDFVLSVSTLMAHKNFDTLLAGFAAFNKRSPSTRLVIAGIKGSQTARLEALRTSLGLENRVEFTGWIPRPQLLELFARARAFVYASRFEGFGIPVLESLSAGIPTACSDIPPLKEIAGEAARYFVPADPFNIEAALADVVLDERLRATLRIAGPDRARAFQWGRSISELMNLFAELSTK